MIAVLHHLGLVLLGGVVFWAGAEHFLRFRVIAASLAERGFPAPRPLLAAGSVLEIVAGFYPATGIGTAYAAAAASRAPSSSMKRKAAAMHIASGRESMPTP
jgi:putative oxidoreductase